MKHLLDTGEDELRRWLANRGQPVYRAEQIYHWISRTCVDDFAGMTDLPKQLRAELARDFCLWTTHTTTHRQADDGTEKLLLELAGGGSIECVLLRDGARRSICISSQVGCAMGCVFCASGLDGVERNLSTGEIIEQMQRLAQLLPEDERISHLVVMGMGEPLANVDRLLPALRWAQADVGLGISPRRITISTVGLPRAIDRLSHDGLRYNLAVSLHAPHDALRNQLVPVNEKIGLQAILAAADRYFHTSGRRLTFEYVLLANVNDQPQHAHQLTELLSGRPALLNVIPYNPVPGLPYRTPSHANQRRFREILEASGVNVQFRHRKGDAINAACGQLRRTRSGPVTLERKV